MRGRRKTVRKILLLVLLLASGCAQWVEVGGLYKNESHNYSVELPQGWMRWNHGDQLVITRDGIPLQYVQIIRRDIDEPLANTKKKFSKAMLPQEASEVILDDIASNKGIADYSLIENGPLVISGIPGFKAIYAYKTKDGLKVKSVYGFMASFILLPRDTISIKTSRLLRMFLRVLNSLNSRKFSRKDGGAPKGYFDAPDHPILRGMR
jgi:hypothetical protein